MFQGLKKLYDNELYANVLPIVSSIWLFLFNSFRVLTKIYKYL